MSLSTEDREFITRLEANYKSGALPTAQGVRSDIIFLLRIIETLAKEVQAARERAMEEAAKCREKVPVLPGQMPDEMWETIRNDRDAAEQVMRIAVRQTLDEYEAAIRSLKSSAKEGEGE